MGRCDYGGVESYVEAAEDASRFLNSQAESDDGAYRFDKSYSRQGATCHNEGYSFGWMSATSYSSMNNEAAIEMLSNLGFGRGELYERWSQPNLVADSLLGIKYVSMLGSSYGYELCYESINDSWHSIYENDHALSLAFAVDSDEEFLRSDIDADNQFDYESMLVSRLLGYDVSLYGEADVVEVERTSSSIEWVVEVPEDGIAYCLLDPGDSIDSFAVSVDGLVQEENSLWQLSMRPLESGRHVVVLEGDIERSGAVCLFRALDVNAFEAAFAELSKGCCGNIDIGTNGFNVGLNSHDGDSLIVTTPPDAGWSVFVNGVEVEVKPVAGGGFMSIPLEEGFNDVVAVYVSPGFALGCAVSAVALLAIVVVLARRYILRWALIHS